MRILRGQYHEKNWLTEGLGEKTRTTLWPANGFNLFFRSFVELLTFFYIFFLNVNRFMIPWNPYCT